MMNIDSECAVFKAASLDPHCSHIQAVLAESPHPRIVELLLRPESVPRHTGTAYITDSNAAFGVVPGSPAARTEDAVADGHILWECPLAFTHRGAEQNGRIHDMLVDSFNVGNFFFVKYVYSFKTFLKINNVTDNIYTKLENRTH